MIPLAKLKVFLAVVLSLFFLAACDSDKEHSAEMFVFGTIVEVKLWGASEQQADDVFTNLQQMFQGMHRDWHAWEPGLLVNINTAFANGEPAAGDPGIVEMIQRAQTLERDSGGRFNPAIGGLIRLWGFHTSDYPVMGPPPGKAEIDAFLVQKPSSRDIHIDGLQLVSDNPHVQLDFGGIAKGYAVDLAIEHIRSEGITSAIVNAGGDLRAMGMHGNRPWRVAVRQPGGGVIGAVEVNGDEALFTSGNYERFRQDKLERYPHILDPRSGWPVRDLASVTVITGEGIVADAAATALVVAGLDDWPAVAGSLGLRQVMVIDGAGTVYMTPEMVRRIQFTASVEQIIVDTE
jgi:thiamine biosynthesis lipoprotein